MEFSCTVRQVEGHVVAAVVGDVDMAAHELFQAEAERMMATAADVTLDCSGVTFMDSLGVRVLVQMRQAAADHGCEFVLASPSQPVTRVLEAAGVSALFKVADPDPDVGR